MTSAALILRLLPRQLAMPLPLRLALAPPSSRAAAARGYFLMVLQQPHRCWARPAAASSASICISSCELYPQAPIAAAPAAGAPTPCPRERKGDQGEDGEAAPSAARRGEKAAGTEHDGSSCSGASAPPSPPAAPKGKEDALRRPAVSAGNKGRRTGAAGSTPSTTRQRARTAKPQGSGGARRGPARPGPPKQGSGGGGGIVHAAPRSASSTSPSSSSSS